MELAEIYQSKMFGGVENFSPKISFEVFPPKNNDISQLFEELRILKSFDPVLISLTYGANGGLNRFSFEDLKSIRDLEFNLMPHFTCVSSLRSEIEDHIIAIENLGIENILALRGDIPEYIDQTSLDFRHANELVEFIKEKTTLSIGVAGYPEGHIESPNLISDIKNLKKKVDAGASAIFTQLFFDNNKFFHYVEKVCASGINLPVVAGIMPIRSASQIEKMTSMARVSFPKKLKDDLEKFPEDAKKIGTEYAIKQCLDLIEFGVCGLHFFTLNHSDQVSEILENIL
ncbi:methylenetetrahydrofolate reductase [bacterium]|nr:methylenetetrahydrofolate reductase [Alphaproteobacteria bacterium]MBR1425551.1 methylenetetrahydrofolate reductase [bacterium]